MYKILVIDDDQAILNFLRIFLLQSGRFEVHTLQDSRKAFQTLEHGNFDILLLDMDMPYITGLDILKHIKENNMSIITIVLTGVEDIDLAITSMKLSTYDYLLKPVEEKKLLEILNSAVEEIEFEKSKTQIDKPSAMYNLKFKESFKDIITQDKKMLEIFHYAEKFATADNSILIWGESGTGKELIARAIHNISNRRENKFVAVNAGSFANELFSSEFFGHEKGAFTGAIKDKMGFIEEANRGTLFLDEIGELSLPIQVKLLRVLQEEEFYKLGSIKNIKVNVRIIAATNKNLYEEIQKGSFRKDLFFRLNINSIYLPSLRERKGDITLLVNHFLKTYNKKYKKNIKRISTNLLNIFNSYNFPGNVRELMNTINSSTIIESSNELTKKSLPHYFLENSYISKNFPDDLTLKSLQEVEKEHIKKILTKTNMNKTAAAKILKISRVNLIAKIKKYELE